jgi:hypothetical protein
MNGNGVYEYLENFPRRPRGAGRFTDFENGTVGLALPTSGNVGVIAANSGAGSNPILLNPISTAGRLNRGHARMPIGAGGAAIEAIYGSTAIFAPAIGEALKALCIIQASGLAPAWYVGISGRPISTDAVDSDLTGQTDFIGFIKAADGTTLECKVVKAGVTTFSQAAAATVAAATDYELAILIDNVAYGSTWTANVTFIVNGTPVATAVGVTFNGSTDSVYWAEHVQASCAGVIAATNVDIDAIGIWVGNVTPGALR